MNVIKFPLSLRFSLWGETEFQNLSVPWKIVKWLGGGSGRENAGTSTKASVSLKHSSSLTSLRWEKDLSISAVEADELFIWLINEYKSTSHSKSGFSARRAMLFVRNELLSNWRLIISIKLFFFTNALNFVMKNLALYYVDLISSVLRFLRM